MDNLFFVEHSIKDKKAWADFMANWMDIMGDEDMTVDKGMQLARWEGNCPLLKCADVDGTMVIGLWEARSYFDAPFSQLLNKRRMTTSEFQEFMDRFTLGASINKVYSVKEALGTSKMTPRNFMQNFINCAQGRGVGFMDKPMLWMTHHQVVNKEGWENKVLQGIATGIKDCKSPSDTMSLGPKGHDGALVLSLSDDTWICLEGTDAGMSKEEFQEHVDGFTKGTAKNTVYLINKDECINAVNLSIDEFNKDNLKWGNNYVNPYKKDTKQLASSKGAKSVPAQGIHDIMGSHDIISQ